MWDEVDRRNYSGVPCIKGKLEHMFLGQYRHNLDSKDRLTVPARYREMLVDGAFVMQGFDRNLMVLTEGSFGSVSRRINQMSLTDPTTRLLKRLIFSSASRVDVDKSGRILIPKFLRQFAGLDVEVILVGAGDFIEIWSPDYWEDQMTQMHDIEANAHRFAAFDVSTGVD
jgi:MraZ protein